MAFQVRRFRMGELKDDVIGRAVQEWEWFGRTTRDIDDEWTFGGNEADEPYRSRISRYWAAVGEPDWDGATPEPWSGAFISWCFGAAADAGAFTPHSNHSRYVRRILNHDGMDERLRLRPPTRAVAPGDLIWNSRVDDVADHETALSRLAAGASFDSHVDIVVSVSDGVCDSIGGNVWQLLDPPQPRGSVGKSTWHLDGEGALDDPRKRWLGVIKNGL
jgi:hypothetical protein